MTILVIARKLMRSRARRGGCTFESERKLGGLAVIEREYLAGNAIRASLPSRLASAPLPNGVSFRWLVRSWRPRKRALPQSSFQLYLATASSERSRNFRSSFFVTRLCRLGPVYLAMLVPRLSQAERLALSSEAPSSPHRLRHLSELQNATGWNMMRCMIHAVESERS